MLRKSLKFLNKKYGLLIYSLGYFVVLSLPLIGCELNSSKADSQEVVVENSHIIPELPITAKTIINGEQIDLEVAKTSAQQAQGLMYRDSIAPDRGMLFPFEFPRRASFWMKNVEMPLDMIFLYRGEVVSIEANVPPCEREPCPIYGPEAIVDNVLELAGGRAEQLNIQQGDRILIQFLEDSVK
ncbi:MAG: DUF192 domain-containing protein [Cyanobacterium sp.]